MEGRLSGNGERDGPSSDGASGATSMLSLQHMHRAVPRAPHVTLGDFRGPLRIVADHGSHELPVLPPRGLPDVVPEDVDPGQQPQTVVDLIERVADQRIPALARDHLVDAKPKLYFLAELVEAELLLSLEPGELPHDVV